MWVDTRYNLSVIFLTSGPKFSIDYLLIIHVHLLMIEYNTCRKCCVTCLSRYTSKG